MLNVGKTRVGEKLSRVHMYLITGVAVVVVQAARVQKRCQKPNDAAWWLKLQQGREPACWRLPYPHNIVYSEEADKEDHKATQEQYQPAPNIRVGHTSIWYENRYHIINALITECCYAL